MKNWNTPILRNIRPEMPVVGRLLSSEKETTQKLHSICHFSWAQHTYEHKIPSGSWSQVSHFTGCTFDAAGTLTVEINAIAAS